jgi:hypothetical protein
MRSNVGNAQAIVRDHHAVEPVVVRVYIIDRNGPVADAVNAGCASLAPAGAPYAAKDQFVLIAVELQVADIDLLVPIGTCHSHVGVRPVRKIGESRIRVPALSWLATFVPGVSLLEAPNSRRL